MSAWLASGHTSPQPGLATVKAWADLIGTIITGFAIIVGAIWAYFKFARGRTFRPRIEIEMSGQWLMIDGKKWLQARIRVANIGASKLSLRQEGSGLRVSVLATDQPSTPNIATWATRKTCAILTRHAWIEPGETVSDDLLLDLGLVPAPVLFEARLIAPRRFFDNIETTARRIIPIDAVASDPTK